MSFFTSGCLISDDNPFSGPAAARPAPDPLGAALPDPSGDAEFERNDGLGIVNAEAAYIRGATGAGVNVAVIDSGIDAGHPDLAGNVSAASYDIIAGSADLSDSIGHGTRVAGVIAAERNGAGTHGVAFDANLIAVNAYGGGGFLYADLATAVAYATDQLAHVINMSISGTTGSSSDLFQSMRRATDAGVFIVIAAGNNTASQPGYPANLAGNAAFDDRVVAVGAVQDDGTLAAWSNQCGSVMDNCLVAPGVGIATTYDGAASATSTAWASGTSFAAPHVSGALALLVQLYPDAYSADPSAIMMFLLDGAQDLGAAGVDAVYGHGLLDVAGAIDTADTAIAAAAVPSASGTASLADSRLSLGPAFGDALAGNTLLNRAIAVIALSDGDHPYMARLGDGIAPAGRTIGLDALLALDDARALSMPIGDGLTLMLSAAGDPEPFAALLDPWSKRADGAARSMRLAGSLGESTDIRLGLDVAAADQTAPGTVIGEAGTLFWSPGETMDPLPGIAGSGNGLTVDRSLGGSTRLSLGLFEGDAGNASGNGGGTALGQVGLSHEFGVGAALRLGVGVLEESAAFLGSRGGGAFATGSGASTQFLTLGGSMPIGHDLELLGRATLATTAMAAPAGSVLGDWDSVLSNALGIAVVARGVLDDGDRFGVLVGQPLRVFDADATATVPVALAEDGAVMHESERVDLTPSGREIDIQLAYDRALAPGMDMSSWLLMQIEPGHESGADAGYGFGLSFRLAF